MTTLNQLLIAEATEYEFKSAVEANKPRSWLKTVSAFVNGVGCSIYFGVSDNGVAIGFDNAQKAAEQVSELIEASKQMLVSKISNTLQTENWIRLKLPA
ncbi:MAG: ATP-binding protein [Dethiobacter sp.]|nr:ATP-binding protein [Dethiobacter sp.]MCL5982692.1 ATP-binding protein [Bacillota bacterium]